MSCGWLIWSVRRSLSCVPRGVSGLTCWSSILTHNERIRWDFGVTVRHPAGHLLNRSIHHSHLLVFNAKKSTVILILQIFALMFLQPYRCCVHVSFVDLCKRQLSQTDNTEPMCYASTAVAVSIKKQDLSVYSELRGVLWGWPTRWQHRYSVVDSFD